MTRGWPAVGRSGAHCAAGMGWEAHSSMTPSSAVLEIRRPGTPARDVHAPRLLVLGAGPVVTEYYAPALRMLGWQRDAVIVDPSEHALGSAKAACSEATTRQVDFRQALDDPAIIDQVDAAVVALPNSLHESACLLALE